MTFVKICGIREDFALEAALGAGADAVGFVFDPASPRYVSPAAARPLAASAQGRALRIGVFVTDDVRDVRRVAGEVGLDAIQWAGSPVPEGALVEMQEMRHIAVLHLEAGEDFPGSVPPTWACLADAPGGPGGMGHLANWEAARQGARRCRLLLAGGLTPDNVGKALREVRPFGVDVSSGVETDGRKDPRKVAEFLRAVRDHDK